MIGLTLEELERRREIVAQLDEMSKDDWRHGNPRDHLRLENELRRLDEKALGYGANTAEAEKRVLAEAVALLRHLHKNRGLSEQEAREVMEKALTFLPSIEGR